MSLRTLYLDTSVVGGYFDKENQKETRQLWALWKSGRFRFVSSVVVEEEIKPAPNQVKLLYEETFPVETRLPLSLAAIELAGLYVQRGVVSPNTCPTLVTSPCARPPGLFTWLVGISGTWSMSNEKPDLTL